MCNVIKNAYASFLLSATKKHTFQSCGGLFSAELVNLLMKKKMKKKLNEAQWNSGVDCIKHLPKLGVQEKKREPKVKGETFAGTFKKFLKI